MMRPTTITPPTARVDAPRSSPPPGASPGGFAALLDLTTARTAPAEGPETSPAHAGQPVRRRDDAAPQDDATTTGATASDEAAAAQAAGTPAPPVADERSAGADQRDGDAAAGRDAPPTVATATDAPAVLPALPDPSMPAGAPAAPVPAVPVDATAAGVAGPPPAQDAAGAGGVLISAELLGAKPDADGQGHDPKDERRPAPDLAQLLAAPVSDAAVATPPAPGALPAAAAAADVAPDAGAAAAPGQTTTPVTAQPAATPFTAVPVAAGVPQLTRASVTAAADRVQDLVRIAATRNGGARATLQLKPVELGTVDVHLRTTREGLVATIAAHDQVGLDALQQAGGELRRSLEDRGVQLHRLDLQLGSGQSAFGNGADAREASSGSRRSGFSNGTDADDETPAEDLSITTVTSPPAGVLVDVQA
jgi:flagellar hook-length control protein FliK